MVARRAAAGRLTYEIRPRHERRWRAACRAMRRHRARSPQSRPSEVPDLSPWCRTRGSDRLRPRGIDRRSCSRCPGRSIRYGGEHGYSVAWICRPTSPVAVRTRDHEISS
jgi:hypothetical protein